MRSTVLVVLAALAAPALAGCLQTEVVDPAAATRDVTVLLPYLDTSDAHDHAAPALHQAGWNLDVVGWNPFTDDPAKLGAFNQVQAKDGYAYVSAYAIPPDGTPGLLIVDVRNPASPEVVGAFLNPEYMPIDVHVSEDGNLAVISATRRIIPLPAQPPAVPVESCTGLPLPTPPHSICQPMVPAGITLLDVSDKAAPKALTTWLNPPSGAHTVKVYTIDGTVYVFAASYGFSYLDRLATAVDVLRFDMGAPGGPALVPVARFFPGTELPLGGSRFVHDMVVQKHLVTGDWLLYVSFWDGGAVIADVNDPSAPRQIAEWTDFDPAIYGNIHFVKPMDALLDGKHVTVAGPEFGSAEHAGETYVLDTTDPTNPTLLAEWRLPGNPVSPRDYMHSPHNFDFTDDGLMVMGHYHAGVWVLDLAPVVRGEAEEPPVVAYRFTAPPAGAMQLEIPEGTLVPNVWHAVWAAPGVIVASDRVGGLYALQLGTTEPGTPPYAGML